MHRHVPPGPVILRTNMLVMRSMYEDDFRKIPELVARARAEADEAARAAAAPAPLDQLRLF